MGLKKRKKIILATILLSRLQEVFGAELLSIEFVDPSGPGEETPEEEEIEEANLTSEQVDCLNNAAGHFPD